MKLRITNYRRFIAMALITSLGIFLIGWGIVYLVQHAVTNNSAPEEETVELVSPENADSPFLTVVNANYPVQPTYAPTDLVALDVPTDTTLYMSEEAAQALKNLFSDAQSLGIDLKAISAYRSFDEQQQLYEEESSSNGYVEGVENVAGGTSEHQTGFAVDLSNSDVDYELTAEFAKTPGGKWVQENAANYGFIIRYPEGKEVVTGTIYEPWHLRYVGSPQEATKITQHNLSLEEYMQKLSGVTKEDETGSDSTKTDD